MRKFYAGIVLNKEELKESSCNRIELEYYKSQKSAKEMSVKKQTCME